MFRLILNTIALQLLLFAQVPSTPPKPNFTGTWKANFQKSVLHTDVPESTVFVVEHKEPQFTITRTHVFKGKSDVWSIQLTTDGKEVAQELTNSTLHARLFWIGHMLVFSSRIVMGSREATNVVRYTMAKDGQSFIASEDFRGAKVSYLNTWILEKQKAD